MRFGKLNDKELEEYIFSNLRCARKEVVLSAAYGEDCAVLHSDGLMLFSCDPITADVPLNSLGALGVNVACNDIAANGGEPIALLITLIMPINADSSDVGIIMKSAASEAEGLNVEIVGGHTEFSDCVIRPLINITAIGKAKRLIKKTDLKAGDKLYITKSAGIEGTLIIASNTNAELSDEEAKVINKLQSSLSVIKEGGILQKYQGITTMHDITEGGVIGSVSEICKGAGLGAEIYKTKIPVLPLTKKLCEIHNINPLRLISSGSMLFSGINLEQAVEELKQNGIEAYEIGIVTNGQNVLLVDDNGIKHEVKAEADELFNLIKKEKSE